MQLHLQLNLERDTAFGRGEGLAGLLDDEVEYDVATGLPFVRGRTLKGLLVEECANLLFAVEQANHAALARLETAAGRLFGRAGSGLEDQALLHIGPGLLPADLRAAVEHEIRSERKTHAERLLPADVLNSLTAIRRQTAVNATTGAPEEGSLRSLRVVLRQTNFQAQLDFDVDPQLDDLALLAACVLCLRRAGLNRNRGLGRLNARLMQDTEDKTMEHFGNFRQLVKGSVP